MTERPDPLVIAVTIEDREDGGVRVYSRDLRGLHLAGSNAETVWEMIAPAITTLLERNHNLKVACVRPSKSPEEAFSELPNDVHMHVEHEKRFVIELEAA